MQFDSEMLCVQNTFLTNLFSLQNILCKNCCAYKTFFVILHEAKLIRLLYSDDLSVKKMQKPDKILMENTNLLQALSLQTPNIGTMRETFFCNQLGYKHQVEYNKRGDYLIDHTLVFEIGGKAKDGKQVANMDNAFIASDDFDYPMGNKLPLWLFGLMY